MKPAPAQRPDDSHLAPAEISDYRSILEALLWVTATRLDSVAGISVLQSRVAIATVKELHWRAKRWSKQKIVEKLHSFIVVFKLLINAWSAYMMQVQPTMADTMLRKASWFFWLTACGETM